MFSYFFETVESNHKSKKEIPLDTARKLGCTVCPLKKLGAYHPDMPPWGAENPEVYFIGEAPGEMEDKENRPFIGKSGQYLQDAIPKEFANAYRLNNTVRSRPPDNRAPTELELACCRNSIEDDIAKTKPKIIVAVGATALQWLIESEKTEIAKWRGKLFPVKIKDHVCWATCIYHPSYMLRQQRTYNGKVMKGDLDFLFDEDMNRVFSLLENYEDTPYHDNDYLKGVVWSEGLKSDSELEKVLRWLKTLAKESVIALDLETTALRPYHPHSKILTVAIGTYDKTYAFPLQYNGAWKPDQLQILETAFVDFLLNSGVKIAHNLKFELEWLAFFYGRDILNAKWGDTYAQAYTLDERKGSHSLDHLIRIHFGFWLKALSTLDKTKMEQHSLEKILPYNGMDTKWTHLLFTTQEQELYKDKKLRWVYDYLIKVTKMLVSIQLRGIHFDEDTRLKLKEQYESELKEIETKLQKLPEVEKYRESFGKIYNPGSPTHLLSILKDILKLDAEIQTSPGKYSTDESVLSKLKIPLASLTLDYRGVNKKLGTYIEPMPAFVMADGRLHANFNPYFTSTGRLCVAQGTEIEIMRDFSVNPTGVKVEDVKPGDCAYTYDENLNIVLRKVTWAGKTGTKRVMRLHWIGDGRKTKGYLDLTCNHPVRMINGEYVRADKLSVGDRVLSLARTVKHGSPFSNNHKIVKIEWLDDMVDVYDLGVEDTHNFIANELCISNSSDTPNMQNFPSKTGKEPRAMIAAPPGHVFVCCDYGQIEARLIGVASQDQNFCKAIWEDYDVHMEWAKIIANEYPKVVGGEKNLDDPKAMKKFRSAVKNLWVFPAFYGAAPKSISAGIGLPQDLTEDIFQDFWKTFAGVKKWQKWLLQRYNKLGYVESFFGRRRHAPLTSNAVINSAIQSSASDICVSAMVELDQMDLQVVLNVHDEIGVYVPENDLDETILTMVKVMTKPRLPWLNIPIAVEVKIGFDWFNMEEIGTYKSTDFYKVPNKPLDFTKIYDL